MNIKDWFKGDKLFIHMFYWIIMLICLCICLFTVRGYNNTDLSNQFAFGATLSGIILSVLAIMMTLIGEMKSDNTKDTLERVSKQIEDVATKNLVDASNELSHITKSDLSVIIKKLAETTIMLNDSACKIDKIDTINDKVDNFKNDIVTLMSKGEDTKVNNDEKLLESYKNVYTSYMNSVKDDMRRSICVVLYLLIKNYSENTDINKYYKLFKFIIGEERDNFLIVIGVCITYYRMTFDDKTFEEYLVNYIKDNYKQDVDTIEQCKNEYF